MKSTKYVAKKPDANGIVHYTEQENSTWQTLMTRQTKIVKSRACNEFLHGLDLLQFPADRIPQLQEINAKLKPITGWSVTEVPALIDFNRFFKLLSERKFPAATFIRTPEELDYLQEPDIFHELFGHCPMLTNQVYADFMQKYGEYGLHAEHKDQVMLARLYWFTVEFGLIATNNGLKIYGGGILSSIGETPYALESNIPQRKEFNILDVFRTPYRIDIKQTIYFIINDYADLYNTVNLDLFAIIAKARKLGMHTPTFPAKEKSANNTEERGLGYVQ